MERRHLVVATVFIAAAAGGALALRLPVVAESQAGDAPEAGSIESLAGKVKVDEFNPDVDKKDGSDGKPVRGGIIRIRMPGEAKSLNPWNDNEETTRQVYSYIGHTLAERDRETFEIMPSLARWWAVRDTVTLVDGTRHEGRIVKETEGEVVLAVGASRFTFADCDLARFEPAGEAAPTSFADEGTKLPAGEGTLVPREGTGLPTVRGRLERPPAGRYTVYLEETPRETLTLKRDQIAVVLEGEEGAQEQVTAIRREAAFEVHLRQGVLWQDGKPLVTDDVLFTFESTLNNAVDCADQRQYFMDLEAFEKRGADGVYFRFKRQFFLSFVSTATTPYIYPRHRFTPDVFKGDKEGFGRHFNTHPDHQNPVGIGPYRLGRWERGRMLELVRNDTWWASGKVGPDGKRTRVVPWIDPERPYLDRIRWIFINDKQAALKALADGEIDADFDIEPETYMSDDVAKNAALKGRIVLAKYLQPLYTYVGWNQERRGVGPERQFFKDRRVRTAMGLLIPQDRILDEIHYGLGERVSGPFFKYGPFNDPSVQLLPYNIRRAQMLLDEAGWIDHDGDGVRDKDGVAFEFEYLIHNMRDYHQKVADITKEAIERAGVSMVIKKLDWPVFIDTQRDQQFDAVRLASGDPSCIDADPYQYWHSSQAAGRGSNTVSFKDPEADALILQVRRTLDLRERQRLLFRLNRLLAREQPVTFMFDMNALYFYDRRYRNVRFCVIGETPFLLSEWYVPEDRRRQGGE